MKKGCAILAKIRPIPFIILLMIMVFPGISLATEEPIGMLAELSGEIYFRSQGAWGGETTAGLPIYSGDKIVTGDGRAELAFSDGTTVTMCHYSVLEFKQWTVRGLPVVRPDKTRRRFTLYMGKILIDTDYKKMRSEIATPPMVAGLRGDAGTSHIVVLLSINDEGEASLHFDEGDRSFVIGPWELGVEDNVEPEYAQNRKFMSNAVAAHTAVLIAQRADEARIEDGISEETRKLAWVRASKAAAIDEEYSADYLKLWTPDKQILADAKVHLKRARERLEAIGKEEQALLDAGALEEEWTELQQAELDAQEGQKAIAGIGDEGIGEPESLKDTSAPLPGLDDFDMPKPGAFAGTDPCM